MCNIASVTYNRLVTDYLDSDHDHNFQAFRKIQHIFRLCMDEGIIFL